MNWKERPAFRKGMIGERLVDEYLMSIDLIPYRPIPDCAHPFDRLVASRDKREIFVAEVKSKPARKYYPDTGINIRHYEDYKHIQTQHNIRVFIAFVDEQAKKIYGNFLTELEKPVAIGFNQYPLRQGGIIYFPLASMIDIAMLGEEHVAALSDLRRSNYDSLPGDTF